MEPKTEPTTIPDLETLVDDSIAVDLEDNEHAVAWTLVVGILDDAGETRTTIYTPDGQPDFSTVGLLRLGQIRLEAGELEEDD